MSVLSRLLVLGGVRGVATSVRARGGHANTFDYRKEVFANRRVMDHIHFYAIGVGFLPFAILAGIQAVMAGACRLEPLPEDRVPRYWEYEDTPLKQLRAWLQMNPQMSHELECAFRVVADVKGNFRKRVKRMEHVTMQRLDDPSFWHSPYKAEWIAHSEEIADRIHSNIDFFKHSFDSQGSATDTV